MNITSGIKQGCTGSTTLFKLITYEIIKELEKNGERLEMDANLPNSLFFADDSLQWQIQWKRQNETSKYCQR